MWGDLNNDGFADLFVGVRGQGASSKLFWNDGAGGFSDVGAVSGMDLNVSIGSATLGDFDADGWLDMFLATRNAPDVLYKKTPLDDALFNDDTGNLAGADFSIAMQATWQDYDLDGDLDLFAVHDGNLHSRFYRQQAGFPPFAETTSFSGLQVDRSSMGVAWGDYNNDGWPDVYVTNIDQGNLFRNNGDGTFADVTAETGVGLNGMSWGVVFADFDNDGDEDLFIGNTYDFDGRRSFLYENRGGALEDNTFEEITFENIAADAGAALATNTFGVATGDFNRDGRLDLVIGDEGGKNRLLLNTTASAGQWVRLQLVGETTNKMAVGARVRFFAEGRMMQRVLNAGDGYCSQSSATLHVGLGAAAHVDSLVVYWPDGGVQSVAAIAAGTTYLLQQNAPINVGTEGNEALAPDAAPPLLLNYPNPFSGKTRIVFELPTAQFASLRVYDALGRVVKELESGEWAAGRHTLDVDLSDRPAGLYVSRLNLGHSMQSRTMLQIK